jgi:hypothetical protein
MQRADESRLAELERKVGQQALEIDFLRRRLRRVEEQGTIPLFAFSCLLLEEEPWSL